MASDVTSPEYWSEIRSIVENVKQDVRENEADLSDAVHEAIDGHQWVFYTGYNLDVLKHCSDESAGIDEGLIDANAALAEGGLSKLTAQLAFCAMERDVFNELDGWSGPEDDDDSERIARGIALAKAEGREIDDLTAKIIASQFHDGSLRALAFISTGVIWPSKGGPMPAGCGTPLGPESGPLERHRARLRKAHPRRA
jgi:hypothetical protein